MNERARNLRKTQTMTESKLWMSLRARRCCGYKFRRQKIFGMYIVDFVCLKKKLVIELDGSQHLDNQEYDENRSLFLNSLRFRVLRFWNNQVFSELNTVLNTIYIALSGNPHPPAGTFSRERASVCTHFSCIIASFGTRHYGCEFYEL